MAMSHYSILILEDSPEDRLSYHRYLSQDILATYDVIEAETGLEALTYLTQKQPDLILLDYQLPDIDALEFLHKLRLQFGRVEIPVIMLTGQGNEIIAVEAMKNGVQDYITKSKLSASKLCCAVHAVMEKNRLTRQIQIQEQQTQLLARTLLHIRQFWRLQEILDTAVQEVRHFLQADRVMVYQFASAVNGTIVAESVLPEWTSALGHHIPCAYWGDDHRGYGDDQVFAMSNIHNAELTACDIDFLEQFQVKAHLVVPMFLSPEARQEENIDQHLWGLLIVHQCSRTREWETHELNLLQQLAVHLAVAIQQAQLYENLQNFNASLEEKVQERTQELQASERRYRAIFDHTFHFTGLLTTEGIVLEVNQTALKFGGIQLEDVINRPFWEADWWKISPSTQEQLRQAIARAAQGEFIRYEVEVFGAENQIATIDFSLRPLHDESGQVVMLIPEGRDITEQKRLERERQAAVEALQASEAELRGLFNALVDVLIIIDQQGRYLKIIPTNVDKLYRPAAELIGKTIYEVLPSQIADLCGRAISQSLTTQQTCECEYSLQIANQELWFHANVSPISPTTVIWAARDITAAKRSEIIQRNVEQALQENQILLQVIMDSLPMAIFWKDRNSRFLGCNRQLLLDAGLSSSAEIIGKTDFDMPWREQALDYQADDRLVMESGEMKFNIEEALTKGDHQTIWLRTNKVPLRNPDGEIVGVLGSYEDITERKQIEMALQASERRYAALTTSAPVGIYRANAQGHCLYVNERWCNKTGLTPEEAAEWGWRKSLHPEDREIVEAQWQRLVQTGEPLSAEYRFVKPDGEEIWVFGQAVAEKDSQGNVIGYVGTITNITSRKQSEAALRRSEHLYRTLVDNFPNGVVVLFDHDLRYLLVGGLGLERAGLSITAMEGKTIWEIFSPPVCEMVAPLLRQALAGESVVAELPYRDRLYLGHHIPVRDENGNVIAGILMTQDITESKQAENALRDSEEKFRQFAENSRQVMLLRQIDSGELLYVNPTYEQIWQQPTQSLYDSPDSWMTHLHPDDCERIHAAYEAAAGQGLFSEEYRIIRPDGSIRWIGGRCFPIRNSAGEIYRIAAIAEDITDRKQTEQERDRLLEILEQQNHSLEAEVNQRTAELRDVIDAIPDYVFVIDRQDMRILYCNTTFSQGVCQQPREQIEGKTIFAALPQQNAENCHQQNQIIFASGERLRVQNTYYVSGNTYTFDTIKVPLKRADGEIYAIVGTSRDISAIKQLETDLHESKERFRNLVETSSDWVWEVNQFGVYTYVSPQIINVLGYTPEEVLGKTPFDLMPQAEAERVQQEFMKFLVNQAPFQCLENMNRHKDGRLITLETSGVPIFDAEQQFCGYRGMDRDITLRKLSELALRQSEARFQRIAANVPGTMYQFVLHPDGSQEFVYISDRCIELFELEPAIILKDINSVFDLIHPEDLPSLQQSIAYSAKFVQPWSWEGRLITPSGRLKWIQGISQPEKQDANGDILWDGLILDISDRKQIEIALRNLSDRLNLAIKSGQIGIWDWDIINDRLIWDERMYELYGANPSDFPGAYQAWEASLHPEDLLAARATIQQAIAGEKDCEPEFRVMWSDGTVKFIKAYAIVQRDHQGKAQRMIGINFDITESRQSEAKLQAVEIKLRNLSDRLKLAVKSAKIGIWELDLVNDSLLWDERMYEIFGVSPLHFNPSHGAWAKFENLLHPEDRAFVHRALQAAIDRDEELDTEFRIILVDGTIRIIKAYGLLKRNAQGQPQRMIGINYDITKSKQEALENKRLKERLEFVLSASPAVIYTCPAYENFDATFISDNVQDILGYTATEWLATQNFWLERIHPEDVDRVWAELSHLEGKEYHLYQYRFRHQDGNYRWIEDEFRLVRDEAGRPTEIIGYVVDISEQQAALYERELAEAQLQATNKQLAAFNEELARATRLKDEFLANMSHELRTPLNAILGISEALQEEVFGVITEKQRQGLQTIERSGKHLLELINDILDLSKIEAGQLQLNYVPVEIGPLCQSSLAFIKQQAFQKRIQLNVHIQPHLPQLMLDERRIRQVLINLLNNAVKFTPEGGKITLEVSHQRLVSQPEEKLGQEYIRIAVIDTGIGIASENLQKLFQPFIQIDSALNRQYAGTGLGLSLVKRLVEVHGGKVGVSSELGVGSCFTIDLPCSHVDDVCTDFRHQTTSTANFIHDAIPKAAPLILLAEDNAANIFTVANYLEAIGYRIILAKDGQAAIALTKTQMPDLILMDIQMPGVDGLEAIKQIRLDSNCTHIPIIALTALAMAGDREKCLQAGANDYLTKPVTLKQLASLIKELLAES
ncbi:two-component hybrid sensor and regulator [Richelia sinica FACHB-800]|uniref:Circadian input-output histidine kinase CikA n=2 Tax=Richelia TaxID=98443 RepID=A0A975T8V9_9NOST|nr:two-component hybrid sensor and regulator [Richelia sinica FACHB-800]